MRSSITESTDLNAQTALSLRPPILKPSITNRGTGGLTSHYLGLGQIDLFQEIKYDQSTQEYGWDMDIPWIGIFTIIIGFLIWREMKKQEITRWVAVAITIGSTFAIGTLIAVLSLTLGY
jgi:hypothetical protein